MFSETPEEAWELRYGQPAPRLPDLQKFLNHRSVRKFRQEPLAGDLVAGLIAAAQSAATSSNLQSWSVISVDDPDRRDAIAKVASDQQQIRDCGLFLAFLADLYRLRRAALDAGETPDALSTSEMYTVAVVDAALAAERLVCAAEHLGLGICYIGALRNDPGAVADILNLPEGVFGLFGLCVGYPSEPMTSEIKPRLRQDAVWFREQYDVNAPVSEYNERMRAFYESQNMKGAVTWSMRSGRRVSKRALDGRENNLAWLRSRGLLLE